MAILLSINRDLFDINSLAAASPPGGTCDAVGGTSNCRYTAASVDHFVGKLNVKLAAEGRN